jgi:dTDP-4-dehydrorhamnose reductase
MRVLVTGAAGLLGTEVMAVLAERGHEAVFTDREEIDITNPESVAQIPCGAFGKIDWCINCAAYTAVDRAENEEQLATELNGIGVSYLAQAVGQAGAKILHISTDFVFDGEATSPYDEEAEPRPLGAYGRSKLYGERALTGNPRALLVRTAWLFGPNGPCFPKTMLRVHGEGKPLRVVSDQIGTPTYTPYLARVIVDLVERDPFPGIYHAAGSEVMSWHEFASRVIETCTGSAAAIEAIKTADWPTPAKRPAYSALSTAKLQAAGIAPMPPLHEALRDFCSRLQAR